MEKEKYEKLRKIIKDKIGNECILANKLNMSRSLFSKKINGKTTFSLEEVYSMIEILDIPKDQIYSIFFKHDVE